jgi:hypothetical protein
LLATIVLAASCGQSDVDRAAYVQENLRLLPTFKNAPFGGYYVESYTTFVSYLTPPETRASDLALFYADDVGRWRRASRGVSTSGERTVCYGGAIASICVRWFPNFVRNRRSGVPFQVALNYGGVPES